jgi:alpha-glucosidase (family GH31 glycosyl hydrolase)
MQDAMRNMFHSAWDNYLNFGSDTGGYRSGTRTKEVFIRWSQLSTFTPLFENGGDGPHGPWEFDEQTVEIYRDLVTIHMDLNPYFLSTGTTRYAQGKSAIWPQASYTIFTPDSWSFWLGDDIFVAPLPSNDTMLTVNFPKDYTWVDWLTNETYQGGTSQTFNVSIDQFCAYRVQGSIIPLQIDTDYSRYGDSSFKDSLSLLVSYVAQGDEM